MGKFNPEQAALIIKNNINPERWELIAETESHLILLNRRGRRRTIKKEVRLSDARAN